LLTDVRGVISAVEAVRRRILANNFLRVWIKWWSGVLIGLALFAAFSPLLTGAVMAAAVLIVVGAGISLVWAQRSQPSAYRAACRLDAAARLQDRLSTALHLATIENPDGIILQQRRDALGRLAQVEPRALFPVRVPAARRTLALVLAVAALFAYRLYFNPPMLTALQKASRSRLVEAVLSPIVHAMEKDPQKSQAGGKTTPGDGKDGEKQTLGAQDATPGQSEDKERVADGNEQEAAEQQEQQAGEPSEPQQGDPSQQGQAQNDQRGSQPQDSQQAQQQGAQPGESQQQQASNSGQPSGADGKSGESPSKDQQPSGAGSERQSLAQSVMQALKNLLSSGKGQQSGQPSEQTAQNGQPSSAEGSQQNSNAGNQNSQQSGSDQEGKQSGSRSSNKSPQDGNQKSSTGIGQEPGSQEMRPNPPLASKTATDRVPLESTDFSGQARVRTTVGPGTAQVPATDQMPDEMATTNGAEQENIPLRYRLYVQKYFDHAGNGKTQR